MISSNYFIAYFYCSLIWLFCSKAANDLINRTTKRAMRITYNSNNEEALDALLQRDGTLTIHKKNLQKLMVEIYKTINHLNPPYMWDLFTKKWLSMILELKYSASFHLPDHRDLAQIH